MRLSEMNGTAFKQFKNYLKNMQNEPKSLKLNSQKNNVDETLRLENTNFKHVSNADVLRSMNQPKIDSMCNDHRHQNYRNLSNKKVLAEPSQEFLKPYLIDGLNLVFNGIIQDIDPETGKHGRLLLRNISIPELQINDKVVPKPNIDYMWLPIEAISGTAFKDMYVSIGDELHAQGRVGKLEKNNKTYYYIKKCIVTDCGIEIVKQVDPTKNPELEIVTNYNRHDDWVLKVTNVKNSLALETGQQKEAVEKINKYIAGNYIPHFELKDSKYPHLKFAEEPKEVKAEPNIKKVKSESKKLHLIAYVNGLTNRTEVGKREPFISLSNVQDKANGDILFTTYSLPCLDLLKCKEALYNSAFLELDAKVDFVGNRAIKINTVYNKEIKNNNNYGIKLPRQQNLIVGYVDYLNSIDTQEKIQFEQWRRLNHIAISEIAWNQSSDFKTLNAIAHEAGLIPKKLKLVLECYNVKPIDEDAGNDIYSFKQVRSTCGNVLDKLDKNSDKTGFTLRELSVILNTSRDALTKVLKDILHISLAGSSSNGIQVSPTYLYRSLSNQLNNKTIWMKLEDSPFSKDEAKDMLVRVLGHECVMVDAMPVVKTTKASLPKAKNKVKKPVVEVAKQTTQPKPVIVPKKKEKPKHNYLSIKELTDKVNSFFTIVPEAESPITTNDMLNLIDHDLTYSSDQVVYKTIVEDNKRPFYDEELVDPIIKIVLDNRSKYIRPKLYTTKEIYELARSRFACIPKGTPSDVIARFNATLKIDRAGKIDGRNVYTYKNANILIAKGVIQNLGYITYCIEDIAPLFTYALGLTRTTDKVRKDIIKWVNGNFIPKFNRNNQRCISRVEMYRTADFFLPILATTDNFVHHGRPNTSDQVVIFSPNDLKFYSFQRLERRLTQLNKRISKKLNLEELKGIIQSNSDELEQHTLRRYQSEYLDDDGFRIVEKKALAKQKPAHKSQEIDLFIQQTQPRAYRPRYHARATQPTQPVYISHISDEEDNWVSLRNVAIMVSRPKNEVLKFINDAKQGVLQGKVKKENATVYLTKQGVNLVKDHFESSLTSNDSLKTTPVKKAKVEKPVQPTQPAPKQAPTAPKQEPVQSTQDTQGNQPLTIKAEDLGYCTTTEFKTQQELQDYVYGKNGELTIKMLRVVDSKGENHVISTRAIIYC